MPLKSSTMSYRDSDSLDLPLLTDELSEKTDRRQNSSRSCSDALAQGFFAKKISTQRRRLILAIVASSLITTLILLGIFLAAYRHDQSLPLRWESAINDQRPGTVSCGTTTEEEISRGCIFDELSMVWMPQKCSQRYNDEYMTANGGGPFPYWVDREASERLDNPSLHVGGGRTFWTSRRNHIVHCQYNLYRLADALTSGDYIAHDNGQSLSDHMHHCVMTMTEFALKAPAHEIDITDVITEPGFGYC